MNKEITKNDNGEVLSIKGELSVNMYRELYQIKYLITKDSIDRWGQHDRILESADNDLKEIQASFFN